MFKENRLIFQVTLADFKQKIEDERELQATGSIVGSALPLPFVPANTKLPENKVSPIQQKVEAAKKGVEIFPQSPTGITQEEKERQETILRGVPKATETAKQIIPQAQSQVEAARIAKAKRRQQILTGELEAGKRIGSQVAALTSRLAPSPEGVTTSQQATRLAKLAGEKGIEEAIGRDPELRRLGAIESGNIAKINQLQEAIRDTEFERAFGTELESIKEAFEETANDKVSKGIKTLSSLSPLAISQMPLTDFVDFAESEGVNTAIATSLHAASILESEADAEKDEEEAMFKRLQAEKIRKEISREDLSKTEEALAGIRAIDEAVAKGMDKDAAQALKESLGFAPKADKGSQDFTTFEQGGQTFTHNKRTNAITRVNTEEEGVNFSSTGNGQITQDYGAVGGTEQTLLQTGKKGHAAVDVAGNRGDPIQAYVAGRVTSFADTGGEYGIQAIVTDKNGVEFYYNHLNKVDSQLVGQDVKVGQVIGEMGNTGKSVTRRHIGDVRADGSVVATGDEDIGQFFELTPTQREAGRGTHLDFRAKTPNAVNGSHWANPNNFIGKVDSKLELPPTGFDLTGIQTQYLNFANTGKVPKDADKNFVKNANEFQKKFRERTKEFDAEFRILRNNMGLGVGVSDEDRNIKFANMYDAMLRGDDELVKRLARNGILDGSEEEGRYDTINNQVNIIENIKQKLNDFTENGKDTGRITQLFEWGAGGFGETIDPDLLELKTLMDMAVLEATRAFEGGRPTDEDRKAMKEIFGNIGFEIKNNFVKLNSIQDAMKISRDTPIRRELGNDFDVVFGEEFFDPLIPSLREKQIEEAPEIDEETQVDNEIKAEKLNTVNAELDDINAELEALGN